MHTPKKKKLEEGFYPRSQYEDGPDSQLSVGYNCLTQTNYDQEFYNPVDKRIILNNNLINLNIGGTKYTTTLSTLEKDKDSTLYKYVYHSLNGLPLPDDDGDYRGFFNFTDSNSGGIMEIFIDRDGKIFQYILNFLRDGVLICPEDNFTYRSLLSDASFYGLSSLEKVLASKFEPDYDMPSTPVRVQRDPDFVLKSQSQNSQIDRHEPISLTHSQSNEVIMPNYNVFLRVDDSDNIEEAMSFVQTTPVRSLGEETFSTTADF
ncbi:predicted protein [Theileria orientalis strain Shintoku]|uniref:BTB domain-containing protein n=1 Tax=Theileria orientalis strain Shintoku TaxID=869250 RepID=J4CDZ3_THEOR|nr:predicted protein [Theileria orientalis strain Shintoku]BAM41992.1 predicted protein [Theileria orientalis strain Shintoku]|eukprot:XP_009692293.1 predicted protein [Theileria orientalis strain Shintoku]